MKQQASISGVNRSGDNDRSDEAAPLVLPEGEPASPMPGESTGPSGSDAILAYMQKKGRPMTRETWLAMAYPDGLPTPWTAELEA